MKADSRQKRKDAERRAKECRKACEKMRRTNREFDIYEHVHRFAAWAASRAASQAHCRFPVACGVAMIEGAGLCHYLRNPDELPKSPRWMDKKHAEWRKAIQAAGREFHLNITDGIAAKLINVYFKAGLVTIANRNDERVGALHPPIDRVLLECLSRVDRESESQADRRRADFWAQMAQCGWSNFNSPKYQEVIDKIREKLGKDKPLWMIEEYWRGHQ